MLPRHPFDLEKFEDQNSRGYVFNDEDDTWKQFGYISKVPLVGVGADGLVYPALFNKIKQISQLSSPDAMPSLRFTDQKPYFYLFYNSDKMLKFKFENQEIWIEVDRAALIRKLTAMPCIGPSGGVGPVGPDGFSGKPAQNEKFIIVNTVTGQFEARVPTPLSDQPISVRGFDQYKAEVFDVLFDPKTGEFKDETGNVISLSYSGETLSGKFSNPKLKFKARQRGPKGQVGRDGINGVEAIESIPAVDVKYTSALAAFYKSKVNGNMLFKKLDLSALKNCVFRISTSGGSIPVGDYWAATELTVSECKNVLYHKPIVDPVMPPLNLPAWTATPGCYDQKRHLMGTLTWQDEFDLPFDIISDPSPQACSCKVPFWFCANSGDAPCDGNIDIKIPVDQVQFNTTPPPTTSTTTSTTSSTSSTTSTTSTTTTSPSTTTSPTTTPLDDPSSSSSEAEGSSASSGDMTTPDTTTAFTTPPPLDLMGEVGDPFSHTFTE